MRAPKISQAPSAFPDPALAEMTGKRVVLVDDVLTTGATASAAAKVLRRAGVARIDVLTFAHALKLL